MAPSQMRNVWGLLVAWTQEHKIKSLTPSGLGVFFGKCSHRVRIMSFSLQAEIAASSERSRAEVENQSFQRHAPKDDALFGCS